VAAKTVSIESISFSRDGKGQAFMGEANFVFQFGFQRLAFAKGAAELTEDELKDLRQFLGRVATRVHQEIAE